MNRRHGTRASYVSGCTCDACRQANTRYAKWREIAGNVQLVDAGPVRDHVRMLRATGVGKRTIAQRSGVALSVIDRLSGHNKHKPARRVRPDTAARILSIRPGDVADGMPVDSLGTARRLQALVAAGWTQTELAQRIGWATQNLCALVHQRQKLVQRQTADRVAALFVELQMVPGPSVRSRRLGERHGWLPPLAWDEDQLDDPDAQPEDVRRKPLPCNATGITLEDISEARAQGYASAEQIGWRLGVSPHAVAKTISRAAS